MTIRKITGVLTLGPLRRHDQVDTIYRYIRISDAYLEQVKIPGVLNSLLRNGAICTLWVATINTPTPFFFKTKIHVVYAVEVNGTVHKAIDEVQRGWTTGKWLAVAMLMGVGLITILLYIGLLFWINAFRLSFVELPIKEMQRDPG